MAATYTHRFNQDRLMVARAGSGRTVAVKLPASITYPAGTILGELIGNNEVVTLTEGTNITAGTYTLTFGGQTTAAIAWNATAAQVQAALEALSTIGVGNVLVTGMSGGLTAAPATITFVNNLGYTNVGALTSTQTSLTGDFAIAVATAGSAGSPGNFKQYSSSATDGSQFPRGLLEWGVTTDASGNVLAENGSTERTASMFEKGAFKQVDVPLMSETIVALMGGRYIQGTGATGGYGVFEF